MNDQDQPEQPEPAELQFDHAEYHASPAAAVTCTVCKQVVPDQYYEINGKVICARCSKGIEASLTGGSGPGRFVRASFLGFIAAVVGCGIYYAVSKITGYNLALISILVGWMVGSAVRRGAHYRGGWVYQGLAIFLTYTAIVAIDIPDIVVALSEMAKKQEQADAAGIAAAPEAKQPAAAPEKKAAAGPDEKAVAVPDEIAPAGPEPKAAAGPEAKPAQKHEAKAARPRMNDLPPARKALALAVAAVLLLVLAYALPFLAGFKNLIGLLIIFFALQQAWLLNRKPKITITGPYQVGELGVQLHDLDDEPTEGAPSDA